MIRIVLVALAACLLCGCAEQTHNMSDAIQCESAQRSTNVWSPPAATCRRLKAEGLLP